MARMLGPPFPVQVFHGVSGAPGGPVSPLPGWSPAGNSVPTRRVVFGVVEPGFLWGLGLGPCAGVRCQGVASVGCLLPPYSWGWARLRFRQVMPGAPGYLWPRGVVAGVVVPPLWKHAVVGGSVACQPSMVPECLWSGSHRRRAIGVDGPEDVEAARPCGALTPDGSRARTFSALVAAVACDRGGRVIEIGRHQPLSRPLSQGPAAVEEILPFAAMGAADDSHRPFCVPHQQLKANRWRMVRVTMVVR